MFLQSKRNNKHVKYIMHLVAIKAMEKNKAGNEFRKGTYIQVCVGAGWGVVL